MKLLNVSVSLSIEEIDALIVDIGHAAEEQKRLGLNYSACISNGILEKLTDAKDRWFQQLEEED